MSWWPMRPAFHLYKHPYKHHRRLTRRIFRGHPSLCAGHVTLCDPAPSDAMTKTLAITGLWGYRHCARSRAARRTPRTVTQNPRSVTTGRNIEHRPAVWRGTIFGSRRARHHPQLTGRAARSRLSPHVRRLTDASRRPSAKTRYRYSVNFREAAAPVVAKSEPLDCSEATAVTLCEPGASAFGRRTVQAPAFPTIAT